MTSLVIWLYVFLGLVPYPAGTTTFAQLLTDGLAVAVLAGTIGVVLRSCPRAAWSAMVLLGVGVFWTLLGLLADAPDLARVWADFRGLLRMSAVVLAVAWLWSRLGGVEMLRRFYTLALAVSAYSLFALVLTLTGSSLFAVRADTASLWAGSYSSLSSALRVSLPGGMFIVAVGVVSLYLLAVRSKTVPTRRLVTIALIAVLVAATSYSRSFFLLAAIMVGVLLIFGPFRRRFLALIAGASGVASLVLFVVYAASTVFAWSAWEDLMGVVQAYMGRVLNGLDPDTLALDSSAMWRTRESAAGMEHVRENWVAGSGFGVPYRTVLNGEIFHGTHGLTYVHSAYLWVLVKTGVLGAIALAGVLLTALHSLCSARLRGGENPAVSVVTALSLAVGVTMLASPVPFDAPGSIVVGGILGVSLVLGHRSHSGVPARRPLLQSQVGSSS